MNDQRFPALPLPTRLLALVAVMIAFTACDPTAASDPAAEPDTQESANEPPSTGATGDPATDSASSPSDSEDPSGSVQPVDTLFASSISGLATPRRELIADADAWSRAWSELHARMTPVPDAPELDFAEHHVVLLAMGSRPTGGYAIDVASMTVEDGRLVVAVREIEPGAGCITTQAVTQPAFAVTVPAVGEAVEFEEQSVVRACD